MSIISALLVFLLCASTEGIIPRRSVVQGIPRRAPSVPSPMDAVNAPTIPLKRVEAPKAMPKVKMPLAKPASVPASRPAPSSPLSSSDFAMPDFLTKQIDGITSSIDLQRRKAQDAIDDFVAIPSKVTNTYQETSEKLTLGVNETITLAKNMAAAPGRIASDASRTGKRVVDAAYQAADAVEKIKSGGGLGAAFSIMQPKTKADQYVARADLRVDEKKAGNMFESLKEAVYFTFDAVEGTGKVLVAVGKGIVTVTKAINELPNTMERTSASTASTFDAILEGIEKSKMQAEAAGEQFVRIVTLEDAKAKVAGAKAALQNTRNKILAVVETLLDISDKIQGKKTISPPAPPKPKSAVEKILTATFNTAGGVVNGMQWLLKKKEGDLSKDMSQRPQQTKPLAVAAAVGSAAEPIEPSIVVDEVNSNENAQGHSPAIVEKLE